MITLEQAKNLRQGTILYHIFNKNSDGSPQRWRVNGLPKTWKTRPSEVRVPVKYGLYSYDYLTQNELGLVCLQESEVHTGRKGEKGLCPICGESITIDGKTTDGRIIGSCKDTFSIQRWIGE